MEAAIRATLVSYAVLAIVAATTASVQSWRQGNRGYAIFAGAVAVTGAMVAAAMIHLWA